MQTTSEQPTESVEQTAPPATETPKQTEVITPQVAPVPPATEPNKEPSQTKSDSNILEKFKNIKFKKPIFGKKDSETKV